jgi:hypothetical protein
MTISPLSGYSGNSRSQAQPRPFRNRAAVVTSMLVCPASIFWSVLMFRSASSASRSCVTLRATRSLRRLAPKVSSWRIVLLLDTPYHAVMVGKSERHDMP